MEDGTREELLQFVDGRPSDVVSEMGGMGGPKCGTQVQDHGFGDGWEAVEFAPIEDAPLEERKEFPFLGKDLVL